VALPLGQGKAAATGVRAYARAGIEPSPLALASDDDAIAGVLTIDILDVIGTDFFGEGVTAKAVTQALAGSDASEIVVRINSPGGSPFEGAAIRSLLRGHAIEANAKIVVEVHGLAASAATIVAAAGDEVRIASDAMFMIHEASGLVMGEASDMRDVAEMLDKVNATMAAIYAKQTGKTKAQIRKLMKAETWMTGAEAVKEGFADALISSDKKKAKATNERTFAALADYERTPDEVLNLYRSSRGEMLVAAMSGQATTATHTEVPPGPATTSAVRIENIEPKQTPREPKTMNLSALAIALGLDSEASEQTVLEAAATMRTQLQTQKAALEEVQSQLVTAKAELAAERDASAAALIDARVEKMVAGEKITPAEATKLRAKIEKFLAAGAVDLLEDELAEIEARGAHSAATVSGLGAKPAPSPTTTVRGRTRKDVERAAADMGLDIKSYLNHQPAFAELFPEQQSA